jgi:hypothetical protein
MDKLKRFMYFGVSTMDKISDLCISQSKKKGRIMKWEYKVIKKDAKGCFLGGKLDHTEFEESMNELGQQSWELVNVFDTNIEGGKTRHIVLY